MTTSYHIDRGSKFFACTFAPSLTYRQMSHNDNNNHSKNNNEEQSMLSYGKSWQKVHMLYNFGIHSAPAIPYATRQGTVVYSGEYLQCAETSSLGMMSFAVNACHMQVVAHAFRSCASWWAPCRRTKLTHTIHRLHDPGEAWNLTALRAFSNHLKPVVATVIFWVDLG